MADVRSKVTRRPRSKLERLVDALSDTYTAPARSGLDLLSQLTIVHLVRGGADPKAALGAIRPLCGKDGAVDGERLAHTPRDIVASICDAALVDEAIAALHAAGEAACRSPGGLDARCQTDLSDGRAVLRALPGISDHRADVLLLHSGAQAVVAPTGHAARVVVRIGYPGTSYAAVARALDEELPTPDTRDIAWRAHHLLDQHGKALCTAKDPACGRCPVRDGCSYERDGEDPADKLSGRPPEP